MMFKNLTFVLPVRNATAVFIMNLALSDLLSGLLTLPLAASTFWRRAWAHGHLLCRLFPLLRYGLLAVSLFSVLAITINRYVMIGHPTLYPRLYRGQYLGLMVGCTWVCGFGALVATWLGKWGRFGLDQQIGSCSILPDAHGRSPKEFLFITAFVIPCIAIAGCYARIFYIVRQTALKSRLSSGARQSVRCGSTRSARRPASSSTTTGPSTSTAASASSASASGPSTERSSHQSVCSMYRPSRLSVPSELLPPPQPPACAGAPQHARPPRLSVPTAADDGASVSSLSASPPCTPRPSPLPSPCGSLRMAPGPGHALGRGGATSGSKRLSSAMAAVMRRSSQPGRMTAKDRKLLKMILVIFASFVICYLPITVSKAFRDYFDDGVLNIAGYVCIYLTTCINPIIYVVMSSEYRQAYKNLLMCRSGDTQSGGAVSEVRPDKCSGKCSRGSTRQHAKRPPDPT
ncbi:G-protein coupled receptor moody [Frankliniella fusca]|nr:G-protein coupled receptor moody [Frankliniella fusca]